MYGYLPCRRGCYRVPAIQYPDTWPHHLDRMGWVDNHLDFWLASIQLWFLSSLFELEYANC